MKGLNAKFRTVALGLNRTPGGPWGGGH